ncbi:hypothetical protein D3C72_1975890 [compost metagenome]
MHQVEVGRHHQVTDELAVLQHPYRPDRDLGIAAQEVEKTDTQITRETLVDNLERRHPAADNAFLAADVIGPYATVVAVRAVVVLFPGHAA